MSLDPKEMDRLETAGVWCARLSEGVLTYHEQQEFEAWLSGDPLNAKALEDCVSVWRAVGEDSTSPALLAHRRDALADFERTNRQRWARKLPVGAMVAMAASIVLLVGAALAWWTMTPTTYSTGLGERRVVALRDGSKVSLDAETTVRVRYARDARRLWLETGRAKFDVAHDPRRPFTVAAADKVVRATGTAFSVELLGGEVRVVLYQGNVSIMGVRSAVSRRSPSSGGPAPTQLVAPALTELTPGHELVAPIEVAEARIEPVDPVRSRAWEGGELVFDNEPLSTAVERMNRYSSRKLVVGDASAGAVLVSGVFEGANTSAFIEGVTGVFPVRTQETPSGVRFVAAR